MTSDVGQLVSTQIELAKVEIKDEVARAGKGAGMVGGGGLAAFVAVLLLSFAIAYWLGRRLRRPRHRASSSSASCTPRWPPSSC